MTDHLLGKTFFIICINILFALLGIFWVYHGNFWNDENWYYHGALLFSKGSIPYTDFFYHRLPLHVEFYGTLFKLIGASFVKGRLISLSLFLILNNLQAYVVYRVCQNFFAVSLSYLAFLTPVTLYSYLTNTTYALSSLLLVFSVFLIVVQKFKYTRLFLFTLVNFLIYSGRYIIDYYLPILVLLITGLILYFRKDRKALLMIFSASALGLLYIFKYTLLTGDTNIIFDTITFNFLTIDKNATPAVAVLSEKILSFARFRFMEFENYYPFNIFFVAATLWLLKSVWLGSFKATLAHIPRSPASSLALLFACTITITHFIFFYISLLDWPVTKSYVFPFVILLALWLISETLARFRSDKQYKIIFQILFVLLFFTAPLAVSEEFVKTSYEKSDVAKLSQITDRIHKLEGFRPGVMLSFMPALATDTLINEPRLNMEMLSFQPHLDRGLVERYMLANSEILSKSISEKKYSVVVLSNRFMKPMHAAKVIAPFQSTLLELIKKNYRLVDTVPTGDFQGDTFVFLPLE